jgi:hypothetical protein
VGLKFNPTKPNQTLCQLLPIIHPLYLYLYLYLKYIINKHGKTHGGVISDEVENAIKMLIHGK